MTELIKIEINEVGCKVFNTLAKQELQEHL
nr:MAG TPA: hypothetical protein [Caudoviricetes sp.]